MRRARRRQRARRTLWPSAVALQPAWLDVTSFRRDAGKLCLRHTWIREVHALSAVLAL